MRIWEATPAAPFAIFASMVKISPAASGACLNTARPSVTVAELHGLVACTGPAKHTAPWAPCGTVTVIVDDATRSRPGPRAST